ncbi:MAG: cell division protein FtsZ [bacterium]|nr:cell division protein FtsZ [bacterium]
MKAKKWKTAKAAKIVKKPKKGKKIVKKAKKILHKKKIVKKVKKSVKKSKPAVKKLKVQSMAASSASETFIAKSFFKAKIKVIGIGGGGGSIVSEIGRSLHKASFVIADTDVRAFKKRRGIKYFLFGQELTHGLGTGLNVDLARRAAESEKEKIGKLFEGQDIVIFIASLGGGLSSGATQVFAEATRNFGGIAFGIFTLPFKFEGKNKYKIAAKALNELRKSLNVSITIPNERIFKIIDANTAITDAFSIVNKNLIESLESLIDLIYSPGVINIDFADLKVILSGRGNLAFLNTAEASGHDRADKVIREILNNPLYQSNNFKTEKVLFNIAGGGNLSMHEVDKISRMISLQCPKAKIIFGISKEPQFKNKIKTTLLMTGPGVNSQSQLANGEERAVKSKSAKKAGSKKQKHKKGKKLAVPGVSTQPNGMPFKGGLQPVFSDMPLEAGVKRLSITEESLGQKRAIRRSALDVKKAEELEENKKSQQEKEWEIPAFLRKVKFKP